MKFIAKIIKILMFFPHNTLCLTLNAIASSFPTPINNWLTKRTHKECTFDKHDQYQSREDDIIANRFCIFKNDTYEIIYGVKFN